MSVALRALMALRKFSSARSPSTSASTIGAHRVIELLGTLTDDAEQQHEQMSSIAFVARCRRNRADHDDDRRR